MSRYTFTFKKDNIFVEFTTEDKDVVERQFQIWVAAADSYARSHKAKTATEKTINTLSQEQEAPKQVEKPAEPVVDFQPQPQTQPLPEPQPAPVVAPVEPVAAPEPIAENVATPLKTINAIQNEGVETVSQPAPAVTADFESVLEKKIENPTFEPERPKDQVFLNLLRSKNTTDKFHYLMITAYYLSEFEKLERFSLKQINAKLMQNLSEVIDHSMLQEALYQNFLELVPDLTGISDVAEYKLTRAGEEFFVNKI